MTGWRVASSIILLASAATAAALVVDGAAGNPAGRDGAKMPVAGMCERVDIDDLVRLADANVAAGDLRPWTVYGFTTGDAPGIFCPDGDYRKLGHRGGTFVSDMPDACGGYSFSNADPAKMEAYNVRLAGSDAFRRATGCRPATYCETRYGKSGYSSQAALDPRCPKEPSILAAIAARGTTAELLTAITAYGTKTAAERDVLTRALLSALGAAKWDNAKALVAAGADTDGRARASDSGQNWLGSSIAQVFNQNSDKTAKLTMARWLVAHGAGFANPESQWALTWAASSGDVEAVDYLLRTGASPNGALTIEDQDRRAKQVINSAGGNDYNITPFYAAIEHALLRRGHRDPAETASANAEEDRAKRIAVRLYAAGGRFFAGVVYGNMYDDPDRDVISILLAAAHREGRLRELGEQMITLMEIYLKTPSENADAQRAALAYLREVVACRNVRLRPAGNHVKICANGVV